MAVAAMIGTGFAGTYSKSFKQPVIEEAVACFADNEFTFDVFATYQHADSSGYYTDGFGGGVGVNAFFARYFGIGVEGFWSEESAEDKVIHSVNGMAILRYPIDSICLAPYVFGGGGGIFNSINSEAYFAGAGLEYRWSPTMGVFGDGRYTWTEENDVAIYRLGLRFAF